MGDPIPLHDLTFSSSPFCVLHNLARSLQLSKCVFLRLVLDGAREKEGFFYTLLFPHYSNSRNNYFLFVQQLCVKTKEYRA
jgi:hypothetical protein